MLEWLWCQAFSTSIPAYAGLYRRNHRLFVLGAEYPRIRGVVSPPAEGMARLMEVSPHTRGCIAAGCPDLHRSGSIPAYAGLYLFLSLEKKPMIEYPRIRGVVSWAIHDKDERKKVSPHTRVVSFQGSLSSKNQIVSPHTRGCIYTQ